MGKIDRDLMANGITSVSPLKRAVDIFASAAGLAVLSPVFLILYIMVARQSPGPAIFSQTRIGWHERQFACLKFRTMYVDAPVRPTHEVPGSHITPIGRILRKAKLDELPQLINVLRGEMSLVGPRPCLPSQEELIAERRRYGVFDQRPGITGLAQIQDIDMSDPARLASVDGEYVADVTFLTDLRILVATVIPFLRHKSGESRT